GLRKSFERIIGLPPEQSDNLGRINHINIFSREQIPVTLSPTLLDVGSGLGVFPYGMQKGKWQCTAIDPDPRAIEHIRSLGIDAQLSDFMDFTSKKMYSLITFNKVLEHVINPEIMLQKSKEFLSPDGLVYIEVPDGEMAETEGPEREEFFVDHHHIFSATSLSIMANISGFTVLQISRLQEPSSKFTLRAFLAPHNKKTYE
ncbi:uncharacterized protein METZ01_LOCUS462386, partial [marine metagenome]